MDAQNKNAELDDYDPFARRRTQPNSTWNGGDLLAEKTEREAREKEEEEAQAKLMSPRAAERLKLLRRNNWEALTKASMDFTGDANRLTKKSYAGYLAAALSYLLLKQNDAVGLVTFDEAPLTRVPARSMRKQLFQVLKVLDELPPGQGTNLGEVLHRVAERIHRRGLILLLTDLMDDPERIISGLKHFRHRGHEVVVFQILDPREVDLDFDGEVEFESLEEPGRRVRLEPAHMREGYQERFDAWRDRMRRECRRQMVDLVEITTDTPFEKGLGAYLKKRRRMY